MAESFPREQRGARSSPPGLGTVASQWLHAAHPHPPAPLYQDENFLILIMGVLPSVSLWM